MVWRGGGASAWLSNFHELLPAAVTTLALIAGTLFYRLSGDGSRRSEADLQYWEHRRRQIIASITEMLGAAGHPPAKKVFDAMLDEFEDVLITQAPVSVPPETARLPEMCNLLRRSLGEEIEEAISRCDVSEVRSLKRLGRQVQRRVDATLCAAELTKATLFLRRQGAAWWQQVWRLLQLCNRESVFWLALGLVIKVCSQVPGPMRMLCVSAAVTAAARGAEGLPEFHQYAIASCWLFAAEKLLQFAGRITMFRGEQLFTLRLKREVYAACLRQDMEFFDTHRCGELQTRLNSDTQEVCQKILYFPVRFLQFSFFLVVQGGTLLSTSPRLVLAMFAVLPFALFGNLFLMKRLQRFYQRMRLRAEVSASKTQEVFNSIRIVRAFAREAQELQRYMRDQEYEARVLSQVNLLQGTTQPLLHAISELSFFVGLYYGGHLIIDGFLSPGEVIILIQGIQECTTVLTDLFETLPEIAKAGEPASRICDLLERPSLIETEPPLVEQPTASPTDVSSAVALRGSGRSESQGGGVEFRDVHFAYASRGDVKVLQGLHFTAREGEVMALVGVTGCGKSTITYLLLRFYAPSHGQILFDGRPLEDYDVHWLRRRIGVVPQESMLFGMSIRENLLYGAAAAGAEWAAPPSATAAGVDDGELRRACQLANAWEFVEQLPEGLSTDVGERGVQLSGGQKQRIAIARAILKQPKVLLLDEATSALDVESEQVVQMALDEVIRASACTTLVIAHRLATIQSATKVVVLSDGVASEEGSPCELAARADGLYARMVHMMPNGAANGCNGKT